FHVARAARAARHHPHPRAAGAPAGIRDRDVETAGRCRALDGGLDGRLVGDVADRGAHLGAPGDVRPERRGGLAEPVLRAAGDGHRRAVAQEVARTGQTDAAAAAGDEGELSFEDDRRVRHVTAPSTAAALVPTERRSSAGDGGVPIVAGGTVLPGATWTVGCARPSAASVRLPLAR